MISDNYKKVITELNGVENFGKRKKLPNYLDDFIKRYNPKSILDFGCGTGGLVVKLKTTYPLLNISGYDPGSSVYSQPIDDLHFDMIVSTDVLEHIEPEHLDTTLKYLSERSNLIYHLIALAPSKVTLSDGRNAHLILESHIWWRNKFLKLGYKIIKEHHMMHKKGDRVVNKYFIMATR